jgi:transcriptional regulator with XRE-family HTH domain
MGGDHVRPNEALTKRRQKMNLTHDEVARRANISRPYYTNIELGRKIPSMKVAKRIADVLHTTVDKIFFDGEVPNRNKNEDASA